MNFDVVIVGGGLTGASLACALKNQNLNIALIDKAAKKVTSETTNQPEMYLNARALALSHVTIQILKAIDIWHRLESDAEPLLEVHISKQSHFGVTRLRAVEHQLHALGYVISADLLECVLNQVLETIPNLSIFRPDEITQFSRNDEKKIWCLNLSSNQSLSANLLIAADGSESYIRKHQGIGSIFHDYQQTAMVLNIELSQAHHGVAYERFTSNGSIAMLPFGEKRVKCVWALPTVGIDSLKNLSDSDTLKKIQASFGYQLGCFVRMGQRSFYPLRSSYAESLYDQGVVFIGNAANTLHPVAAQGFNLGLRDVATLAELIVDAKNVNQDIGSTRLLKTYSDLRQKDHKSITDLTNLLANPGKLQWLGVLSCEWLPPLKRWIARQGLGMEHNLAKLCRGVPF